MKLISVEEPTAVERPDFPAPLRWPRLVEVMVSDADGVTGQTGLQAAAMLKALYANGYAVVELGAEEMAGSGTWDVTITDHGAHHDDVLGDLQLLVDDLREAEEMVHGVRAVVHDVSQEHAERVAADLRRAGATVEAVDRLAECDAIIRAQREGSQ